MEGHVDLVVSACTLWRPHEVEGLHTELQVEEARVGAVQQAEAIAPGVDLEPWPALAVDDDHAAEELGHPVRMDVGVLEWSVDAGRIPVGEQQLAVGVELAVLDDQLDFLASGRQLALPGHAVVAVASDQVERGEA